MLQVETHELFLSFNFDSDICDSDRLIYILIAMVDLDIPVDICYNAILVLEGLTYYIPGKRKAILAGAIEQLDKFIRAQEDDFATNLDTRRVSILECFSNVIGSR